MSNSTLKLTSDQTQLLQQMFGALASLDYDYKYDDDSWLVTIHNDLQITEHYKTLFHEFQHIVQDIYGIKCEEVRENEAYHIEGIMYKEMCAT